MTKNQRIWSMSVTMSSGKKTNQRMRKILSLRTLMGRMQSPSWFTTVPLGPKSSRVHLVIFGKIVANGLGPHSSLSPQKYIRKLGP